MVVGWGNDFAFVTNQHISKQLSALEMREDSSQHKPGFYGAKFLGAHSKVSGAHLKSLFFIFYFVSL